MIGIYYLKKHVLLVLVVVNNIFKKTITHFFQILKYKNYSFSNKSKFKIIQ